MGRWPTYHLTDLYKEYVKEFLDWRAFNQASGHSIECDCPSKKEMVKWAALMDLVVRLQRSNESKRKRGDNQ